MVKKPPINPGGFPVAQTVKNPPSLWETWARSSGEKTGQSRRHKTHSLDPWVRKIPWRRAWQSAPVFLPGESHGQVSLAGYSSWGRKESDMTEVTYLHAHTHTHIWTDGQMDGGPSLGTLTCQALSRYWVYSREENVGI